MLDPELAKRIKLVGLDVDGTLTDGGVYLGDVGGTVVELKRYDIQDGVGISILRGLGIKVVIVTGRVSESVRKRAAELSVDDLFQDPNARKLQGFMQILERQGIELDECAFVGDDFPDVPILKRVALPVAVGNAVEEVREMCSLRLRREGGRGAVREFCETLLRARGQWEEGHSRWVAARTEEASPAS